MKTVPSKILTDQLTGKDPQLMIQNAEGKLLHPEAAKAFEKLQVKALNSGFKLKIVSGFRSFEDQKKIWQAKASGQLLIRDSLGHPLEYEKLTEQEVLAGILRWSAIPGASRHHWGSDLDIIDAHALTPGQKVELTPEEVAPNGPFGPLHAWLDDQMEKDSAFGFFRPYAKDLGGVAPERWHLSYRPLSEKLLEKYTLEVFEQNLKTADLTLGELLLKDPKSYYERFVLNISA